MYYFLCWAGGGKINLLGQLASWGEDNQGGRGKIAQGQAVQGGNINWGTGILWNTGVAFI